MLTAARAGVPERGELPKYFQVKQKIDAVLDELGLGTPLPTEREFAERFGVSRISVRRRSASCDRRGGCNAAGGRRWRPGRNWCSR
jgi:DNA-binding transcriptional MocR family regulator